MFELEQNFMKEKKKKKMRLIRLTDEQEAFIRGEMRRLLGLSFQAYAISRLFPDGWNNKKRK